jgi:hypothetical protein
MRHWLAKRRVVKRYETALLVSNTAVIIIWGVGALKAPLNTGSCWPGE